MCSYKCDLMLLKLNRSNILKKKGAKQAQMQSEVSHGNQSWFMLMSGAANTLHMSKYHNYAREKQPHQYSLSITTAIRENMTASTRQPLPRVRIMANALRLSAAWKVALGTALRSKMRSVLVLHHSTLLRMQCECKILSFFTYARFCD